MTQKRRRLPSGKTLLDLQPDVLILILTNLNHNDRLHLSLVSNSFRSITDTFVSRLTFLNLIPSPTDYQKLLARFSSVTQLIIHSNTIIQALTLIADSASKIECLEIHGNPLGFNSFNNVKDMVCLSGRLGSVKGLKFGPYVRGLEILEFVVPLFHSLEEIDLSCDDSKWSDAAIERLVLNCRNLRKINLDYMKNLTDRSLDVIATCCVNLENVSFRLCFEISLHGVWGFLQKAKNLKSLQLPSYLFWSGSGMKDMQKLVNANPVCKYLSHLSIDGGMLTDSYMFVIAGLRAPLTSLKLSLVLIQHNTYTMAGLSAMLKAFPGLIKLSLDLPWPGWEAQDMKLSQLVMSLPFLKDVRLVSWSALSLTLSSLLNNCSLLECIYIKTLDHYTRWDMPQGIRKNKSIQNIDINPWPNTFSRTALKQLCRLGSCCNITNF